MFCIQFNKTKLSLLSLVFLIVPTATFAGEGNWFVGMGMSAIKYNSNLSKGFTTTDNTSLGGGISVGRDINDNFLLKFAYDDLGRAEINYIGTVSYEEFSLTGQYAATELKFHEFLPYLRGGLSHTLLESTGGIKFEKPDNIDPVLGLGLRYNLGSGFVTAEFTNYNQDINAISLSIHSFF